MLLLPLIAALAVETSHPACHVAGRITASNAPLPGVALTVSDGTTDMAVSSSDLDGAYLLAVPGPGRYSLKAGLAGFAESAHDVELTAEACAKALDFSLTLKSRVVSATPTAAPAPPVRAAGAAPGQPPRPPGAAGRFQDLSVTAGPQGEAPGGETAPDAANALAVPQGFSGEAPTDAVTTTGGPIEVADSGFYRDRMEMLDAAGGDIEMMARRMSMGMDPGGAGSMMMMPGGGFGGGGGVVFMGGRGGGGNRDRLQGNVSHTIGGSALDAAPYRLEGQEPRKAGYLQNNASASLSGPVRLPGIYDGRGKTQFTLSYSGSWSRRPYDAYSTVPTEAERAGDLSSRGRVIFDPRTGAPFPGGVIPESRIDPSSRALLDFIPRPNLEGNTQNFYYLTTNWNHTDNVSLRLNHRFGEPARGRQGGRPGGAAAGTDRPPGGERTGAAGRGAGGAAARRGALPMGRRTPTLNLSLNHSRFANDSAGRFPSLGSESENRMWAGNINVSFGIGRTSHQSNVSLNRGRSSGVNRYAFTRDVAGEAGIGGVATDPFDWGVPNLSFTTFADLNDGAPRRQTNQRWNVGHSVTYPWKKHSIRVGADFRAQSSDSRVDPNARGTFTFTGLYTSRPGGGAARDGGLDFADFLLGLPQQASVQYGPGETGFRSQSFNLHLTDDWRLSSTVTLNAGLRYEYVSPLEEKGGRLVNLDVPSDFTAAAPVAAGERGPFTGLFPESLVYADRNNVAPRVGLAWRPNRQTTVRTGYGLNYNLGAYQFIAQRLSGQPPFAVSNTSQGTPAAPLTFASPFVTASPTTVTNSYGIDKHYQLGAVQIWNLDITRELPRSWNVGGSYTGTAGRNLDIQRAPNRDRNGLRIPNVQAFLWQSSEGESNTHALSLRVRKRMGRGFSAGANYSYSRSRDNASSVGGGGMVVAQDDRDLEAEWGRSSFERRHRFFLNYNWELPFGTGRRWLQKGVGAAIASGWTWNGNAMIESGAPFTARVRGDFADVARGVNGTLRADDTGASLELANPAVGRWFNTDAFTLPPAGQFGTAARNTITGPGTFLVNMGLSRDISLGRPRTLSIRVQANNVLNTPNYGSIDTVVNSPTFGRVTSVRSMRSVQITTRVRF